MKKVFTKHKWKIVLAAVVLAALGFAFWYGGNAPGLHGWTVSAPTAAMTEPDASPSDSGGGEQTASTAESDTVPSASPSTSPAAPSAEPSQEPSAPPSAVPSPEPSPDSFLWH